MSKALRTILVNAHIRTSVMAMFCYGITMAATLPYQSVIGIKELGLGDQKFAVFMFAAAVVNVVAAVALGVVSDSLRNRKLLVLILSACGVAGYGLIYLLPSQQVFIICMLTLIPLARSAFSMLMGGMRREMRGMPKDDITSINSSARAIFALAWIAVPGLVGWWLKDSPTLLPAFLVASLASLAMILIYGGLIQASATEPANSLGFFGALQLIGRGPVVLLVIALALGSGAHTLHSTLHPLVMTGPAGGSLRDVGLYAGLLAGLEIPFMLLWAKVASRYSLSKAMASALCVYALYAVLMAFASAPWHLFAIAVLNSAGAAAVLSLPVSAFQEMFNDRPGLGTSLVPVMTFIGAILSSAGFALGTALSGYSGSAFVISAMCLMGVACLVLLERWNAP